MSLLQASLVCHLLDKIRDKLRNSQPHTNAEQVCWYAVVALPCGYVGLWHQKACISNQVLPALQIGLTRALQECRERWCCMTNGTNLGSATIASQKGLLDQLQSFAAGMSCGVQANLRRWAQLGLIWTKLLLRVQLTRYNVFFFGAANPSNASPALFGASS